MPTNPIIKLLETEEAALQTPGHFWAGHNIKHCYCMLITGRCGSTLVTNLIKSLNIFGNPDEFFTEDFIPYAVSEFGTNRFSQLLPYVIAKYSAGAAFGFQIDPLRLERMKPYWDIVQSLQDSSISLVVMKRYDLLSQAYSYLVSKKSGLWHLYPGSNLIGGASSDQFIENLSTTELDGLVLDLFSEVYLILQNEMSIDAIIRKSRTPPVAITYEETIADRFHSLYKIFRGLNADAAAIEMLYENKDSLQRDLTLKNPYMCKERLLDRVYANYRDIATTINTERVCLLDEVAKIIGRQ